MRHRVISSIYDALAKFLLILILMSHASADFCILPFVLFRFYTYVASKDQAKAKVEQKQIQKKIFSFLSVKSSEWHLCMVRDSHTLIYSNFVNVFRLLVVRVIFQLGKMEERLFQHSAHWNFGIFESTIVHVDMLKKYIAYNHQKYYRMNI